MQTGWGWRGIEGGSDVGEVRGRETGPGKWTSKKYHSSMLAQGHIPAAEMIIYRH